MFGRGGGGAVGAGAGNVHKTQLLKIRGQPKRNRTEVLTARPSRLTSFSVMTRGVFGLLIITKYGQRWLSVLMLHSSPFIRGEKSIQET